MTAYAPELVMEPGPEPVSGRRQEPAASAAGPQRVVLRVTPEQIGNAHRGVPALVREARSRLAGHRVGAGREIVLDLSALPPMPAAAPLLLLLRLLRGVPGGDGRIEVRGVSPALAAALTGYDLPDRVTLVDRSGRRWPA